MARRTNRREFIQQAGVAGAGVWCSASFAPVYGYPQNDKVNFAAIGAGGQGGGDRDNVAKHANVVAQVDIDRKRLEEAGKKYPGSKLFTDYRKLFDQLDKQIDAVTVGTPDNHHACASIMAMKLGKHCYTEKPLTHDVYEARMMAQVAREKKVATQMGNQGSANGNLRRSVEIIQAGGIGEVKEMHIWTNRPVWPQSPDIKARPKDTPPVPEHIDWDNWLGPAPERPYHKCYHPFAWRGWWDFGTGALGDMACHTANLPFRALKLGAPSTIQGESEEVNPETYPGWARIRYEFPAREGMPPCTVFWYEGKKDGQKVLPPVELFQGEKINDSASLIVGSKGTMYSPDDYGGRSIWLPKGREEEFKSIKETLPRAKEGHHKEWIDACKGGPAAFSNFPEYAGPLTEFVLLGNVAIKFGGKKLEWDGAACAIKNSAEANASLKREYRKGWSL